MKTYKLRTLGYEHSIPVKVGAVRRYFKFMKLDKNSEFAYFATSEKAVQAAIEQSSYYTSGQCQLIGTVPAEVINIPITEEITVDDTDELTLQMGEDTEDANGEDVTTQNEENSTNNEDENPVVVEETTINEEKSTENEEISTKSEEKAPMDETPLHEGKYFEVTTYQQAKAVLTGAPYNVSKNAHALRSPDGILKKAAELGVEFPNLK